MLWVSLLFLKSENLMKYGFWLMFWNFDAEILPVTEEGKEDFCSAVSFHLALFW